MENPVLSGKFWPSCFSLLRVLPGPCPSSRVWQHPWCLYPRLQSKGWEYLSILQFFKWDGEAQRVRFTSLPLSTLGSQDLSSCWRVLPASCQAVPLAWERIGLWRYISHSLVYSLRRARRWLALTRVFIFQIVKAKRDESHCKVTFPGLLKKQDLWALAYCAQRLLCQLLEGSRREGKAKKRKDGLG